MKNYIIGAIIVICLVGLGIYLIPRSPSSPSGLGGFSPPINYATTNASTTCSTVVSSALSANSTYQFRSISNAGTSTVYLWESSTSTGFTGASGIAIVPSSTITMSEDQGNLWRGTIYCLTSVGTSTLTYTQW